MQTDSTTCYSDHDHDIRTVGVCEMCGGTHDTPGSLPDQAPPEPGAVSQRYVIAKRVVTNSQYEMLEGTLLDLQTANVMVLVYEAIKPENQAKFDRIPLMRLVEFCWKACK